MIRSAGAVAAVALLAATVLIIGSGDAFLFLTGLRRNEALRAPDDVHAASRDDPMPFLIARDCLEVRVDSAMTVRELLDANRLNKPNLRAQVLAQLGNPALDATVDAGTTLRLALTPKAPDVPGTSADTRCR